tara:strand:+ start:3734 stop:4111 length:378 start_codon:yes stop_codon:yes gene_type:complete
MTKLKLTKPQQAVLDHRLSGVDMDWEDLFELYKEGSEEKWGFNVQDCEDAEATLYEQIVVKGILDTSEWNAACPEVLADLIEGSTWIADPYAFDTSIEYTTQVRLIERLTDKLEPLVGRGIDLPE